MCELVTGWTASHLCLAVSTVLSVFGDGLIGKLHCDTQQQLTQRKASIWEEYVGACAALTFKLSGTFVMASYF